MRGQAVDGVSGTVLKKVHPRGHRRDACLETREVIDLLEVRAEEPLMRDASPLGESSALAHAERGDLAVRSRPVPLVVGAANPKRTSRSSVFTTRLCSPALAQARVSGTGRSRRCRWGRGRSTGRGAGAAAGSRSAR